MLPVPPDVLVPLRCTGSGPCYPVLLPTVSVLNKCFPQPPPGLTAFVDGVVNASAAANSTTVSANATVDFQFVASMAANLSKNKLQVRAAGPSWCAPCFGYYMTPALTDIHGPCARPLGPLQSLLLTISYISTA